MGRNTVTNVPTNGLKFTGHKPGVDPAYEATARQAATQEEADEIIAVAGKLVGLNDRDLYLAARDDEPVAKRIGASSLAESTLTALANYEQEKRERERERERVESKWIMRLVVTGVIAFVGWSVALY